MKLLITDCSCFKKSEFLIVRENVYYHIISLKLEDVFVKKKKKTNKKIQNLQKENHNEGRRENFQGNLPRK